MGVYLFGTIKAALLISGNRSECPLLSIVNDYSSVASVFKSTSNLCSYRKNEPRAVLEVSCEAMER